MAPDLDAPDTAHSALITDHKYNPGTNENLLCKRCGLGQASHRSSVKSVYEKQKKRLEELSYRCPDCVNKGVKVCPHPPR